MNPTSDDRVTICGRTNFRHQRAKFGIRQTDRLSHLYIIGKSGTGKTTLLNSMIRQDIAAGQGVAVFDAHGDLIEDLIAKIPDRRRADLIYLNVPDPHNTVTYNPLRWGNQSRPTLAAAFLLDAFKKLWPESWGPRVEHLWRNVLLVLLDQPHSTLADVPRLLNEDGFRRQAATQSANSAVRDFWLREYAAYPARFRAEVIAPLQNKVGAFLTVPRLRTILTQPEGGLNLRETMDDGRILLVNLAKGLIGEDAASLLGALLISGIGLAALNRAGQAETERRDFFVYLDEFQNYATLSLANMLAELRKYHVGLTLAHQHFSQLDLAVRDAILGNAGSMACFRIGVEDATILEKEFFPPFRAGNLVALPNWQMYVKLMVSGVVSKPFSAEVISPSRLPIV